MEELNALARLITNNVKNIPLFGYEPQSKENTLEYKLYQAIRENNFELTEEKAAKLVYGERAVADNKFSKLKSRLSQKLYNYLYFLDFTDERAKEYHKNRQHCLELIYFSEMLVYKGNRPLSLKMAGKASEMAQKAEFTDLLVKTYEIQADIYAKKRDSKNLDKTQQQLDKYLAILNYERKADSLFRKNRIILSGSVRLRVAYLPKVKEDLKQLYDYWQMAHSYNVFELYYMLDIWYLQLTGDFKKIIEVTGKADILYQEGKINALRFDIRLNKFMKVYALLRTGQYEAGLLYAEQYLGSFDENSHNWFAHMENYFLLALQARQYDLSADILRKVSSNPFRESLSARKKALWQLYNAYLYFADSEKRASSTFNYHKLEVTLSEYSKDKEGFNISLLILQFMSYLNKGAYDVLIDRVSAIDQYIHRHLMKKPMQRSKLFLRLLKLIVTCDFHYPSIVTKSAGRLEKLKATPVPGDAFAEIEIIPYEHLWEICLDMVKQPGRTSNHKPD